MEKKEKGAELGPYSLSIPRCEALFSHSRPFFSMTFAINVLFFDSLLADGLHSKTNIYFHRHIQ